MFIVDNSIFLKGIMAALLILWVISIFRTKKEQSGNPVIAEADAQERYAWRYFRWVLRLIQFACALYFIQSAIKYILA